jgi:hypothetical protein
MTAKQRHEVKQTAQKFYRAGRITLGMAIWAMKNAGYTREETAEWLELKEAEEEYADRKVELHALA